VSEGALASDEVGESGAEVESSSGQDESESDESGSDASGSDESSGGDGTGGYDGPCAIPGLVDPGPLAASAGQPVHHFTELTHTGEIINICSFAGKPMMIDLCAVWCGPCNSAASCIAGNDAECGNLFQGGATPQILNMVYQIRANLEEGRANWIEVQFQTNSGQIPTLSDLVAWDAQYGSPNVWVFTDTEQVHQTWLPTSGIPFFVSVDANFRYWNVNNGYEWSDLAFPWG
jgi:hypothetical protein